MRGSFSSMYLLYVFIVARFLSVVYFLFVMYVFIVYFSESTAALHGLARFLVYIQSIGNLCR